MKFPKLLLTIAASIAAGCTPQPATVDIRSADAAGDCTPRIREILEAHPEGNLTIRFEEGVYDFYPEQAAGAYFSVSNNDNGYKRCVFLLAGMRRVSIEGCGERTLFRFHGGVVPFRVTGCREIRFSGFTIDYDASFVFEARVVGRDPATQSITLRPLDPERFEIVGGQPRFRGYDWSSPFGENILFDPETRSPYYAAERYEHNPAAALRAERLCDTLVRLSGYTAQELPPVGAIYTDKGPHSTNRRYPGFSLHRSERITLEGVTVRHSGGMALTAERCADITCRSCRVMTDPESGRMVSASADATHFIGCSGRIRLIACRFESMLDDATNIHGTYMKLTDRLSAHRFAAAFGHFQQEGYDFAEPGDPLLFVDRTTLGEVGRGRVAAIDRVNENRYLIETDFDLHRLPDGRPIAVESPAAPVSVEILGCTVRYNRARSLLISTPGDVRIEDCDLSSMMAGIRICGDANYWFESGRTQQVVIRRNRFRDLATGGWTPQAVLQIDPVIPHDARGGGSCYHGCIRFEENDVETFDDQIVYALSVDSLVIRGNRFADSRRFAPRYPGLSALDVQHCRSVTIEGNDFSRWKSGATISLIDCPERRIGGEGIPPVVENPNRWFYEN